jgi:hypothetical protein
VLEEESMASSKEYLDFIMEQLSDLDEINCKGNYLVFGQQLIEP